MQAVRAARYSPKGHLSWHLSDPSDGISYGQSESVSRSMQALNTAVVGAMPGPSPGSLSSRSLRAGGSVLTVSGDENSTHMRAANSEKLRPPSSGPAPLSRASDQGRASWHEARGPEARAASISLPGVLSPHGSLDYRTAASALDSQTGLECRLLLPHGTRGHKRPRLEDKLREGMAVRAFLADRHSNFDSGEDSLPCSVD